MKSIRSCAALFFLAGIIGCCPAGHGSASLRIAQDGNPLAVIVLPDEPGDTEEFAAEELQSYLEKITGAELAIKPESEAGNRPFISVGRTRLSETAREPLSGKPADAFVVESVRNGIVLAGGGDSGRSPGTLFAVYDFLERDLGCRWLGPGEVWEHVPKRADLSVAPADRLESPAMLYRQCTDFAQEHGWSVKNKANMGGRIKWPFEWISAGARGDDEPVFRTPGWSDVHGGPCRLLPSCRREVTSHGGGRFQRRMLSENPEWYPLLRDGSRSTQWLCHSNPELNDLLADRLSQMLRERPYMDFVQLGEGDGYGRGVCQCDACLELEAEGGGTFKTNRGIYAYRWRAWENRVADMLAETDPGKKLLGVAYGGGQEPLDPELIRPAENVMMDYYTWANCRAHGYEHPIEDETRLVECLSHADSREWMKSWSEMTPAGMIMSEYLSRNAMLAITAPMPRRFVRDMRYLREHGFVGYRAFTGGAAWSFYGINRYAVLKAGWNPDLDEDELVRDFCDHAFHEAGEHMVRFLNTIEEAVRESGCCHSRLINWTTDLDRMAEARRHLDAAHAAAEGNEIVQKRLVSWEAHFEYAVLAGPPTEKIIRGAYQDNDAAMLREGLEEIQAAVDYADEIRAKLGMQRRMRSPIIQERPDLRTVAILGMARSYLQEDSAAQRILARLEDEAATD